MQSTCLVDRYGAAPCGGVGFVASVELAGGETEGAFVVHRQTLSVLDIFNASFIPQDDGTEKYILHHGNTGSQSIKSSPVAPCLSGKSII